MRATKKRAEDAKTITILSLGAGVQSSTLLLMACEGILPKPDAAIFADTGWEPEAVYTHLRYLEEQAHAAGIPVYRVSVGNLKDDLLREAHGEGSGKTGRIGQPPFYVHNDHPEPEEKVVDTLWGAEYITVQPKDGVGKLWRKCTKEYKLDPIRRQARALMQAIGATHINQWIGISLDEVGRVKPSGRKYITNLYPLLDRHMTRGACLSWLRTHGYPEPAKSACLGCPFHSDAYWRDLRESSPGEWADTVAMDAAIRSGIPGVKGHAYMHRSCQPLDQVNLDAPMATVEQPWLSECEGICGI